MQFLTTVSHYSMGAHTEVLCLTADSSISSDEDETYEASPATTSESSATAAALTDDCCEVCVVAPREGCALVPSGHARFCDSVMPRPWLCTARCSPVCQAPIRMVMLQRFLLMSDARRTARITSLQRCVVSLLLTITSHSEHISVLYILTISYCVYLCLCILIRYDGIVYVCIKRKIQKILTNKVRSLPVLYYAGE